MTAETTAWLLIGINIGIAGSLAAWAISARHAVASINRRRQR